jgi:hypothetical protein
LLEAERDLGEVEQPTDIAVVDIDRDGVLDLVTPKFTRSGGVRILLGQGGLQFCPPWDNGGCGVPDLPSAQMTNRTAIGDLNNDGKPDYVTSNYGRSFPDQDQQLPSVRVVYTGDNLADSQNWITRTIQPIVSPRDVSIEDVDRDGRPEVLVLSESELFIYSQDIESGVTLQQSITCGGTAFGIHVMDLNGDGFPDLVVPQNSASLVLLLLNDGRGRFVIEDSVPTSSGPDEARSGDFNRDGIDDLVVVTTAGIDLWLGTGLWHCVADFNRDGGVDGGDVVAFFTAWESGACQADANRDGGTDFPDAETFFVLWEQGGC